ncbi:DNA polymerase [Clostridia bacterium]|nr:DNA polymerase [Clostridia bacterium]
MSAGFMSGQGGPGTQGVIRKADSHYPILLSLIKNPPGQLSYAGNPDVLKLPMIAIVGSRSSTDYGRWAAYTIAKRLSDHGVCVVSGMAEGIDTAAHQGALAGRTPTIAVFGCGLAFCYPRSNLSLMRTIERNGLLLSEYEDVCPPSRYSFPARNRIISGLSYATVVAEAGFSSGSLITAEHAAEQGREVYAVPGNINRKSSIGCNKLIADGARPIIFIDDILSDLGIASDIAASLEKSLTAQERRVMEALRMHGELSHDRLATETGLSIGTLTAVVTLLEIKNCLSTGAGKVFLNRSLTS